jgi:hypothetical protein
MQEWPGSFNMWSEMYCVIDVCEMFSKVGLHTRYVDDRYNSRVPFN